MFAPIYRSLARMGFGQGEADEMELWVIATVLDTDTQERPAGGLTAREINAARVAAARGDRPPPRPPGMQVG